MYSCNNISIPDLEKEKKEILRLEAKQREYHFTKNTRAFVDMASADFISIDRGVISKPSKEASYERFDAYFKAVEFVKWDDKNEPVIRFSNDGSIAYVAVDKLVVLKLKDESGKEKLDTTNFAWLTVYKKENSGWKTDCVASTNK